MRKISPFVLMNTIFFGLILSLAYSLLGAVFILYTEGRPEFQAFLVAYNITFRNLISLGLIIGTALVVFRSQGIIPSMIEKAFTEEQLLGTEYYFYKRRFISWVRSATFAIQFGIAAAIIFYLCQFPLQGSARVLMVISACVQYAFGVYVGRKLFYAAMMLHSLLNATVNRNLFRQRELDEINAYVHIVSTLTIIFGYAHLTSYNEGPFLYQSMFGESVKVLLMLPALIGTPVLLIFNFYPRVVLRKLYDKSVDFEVKDLQAKLQSEELSSFEKKSYVLEFDRMSREELRYSLQLTLSDLPIGITILVMILEPLLGS